MADTSNASYSALATPASSFTDQIPSTFTGTVPTQTTGGLSPLQLALVNALASGNPPAFSVNQTFLKEMRKFSDSGIANVHSIGSTVTGFALTALGDDIYMYRRASDCGPDEVARTEQVYLGTRTNLAYGSFAHYGPKVDSGTLSDGSSVSSGGDHC